MSKVPAHCAGAPCSAVRPMLVVRPKKPAAKHTLADGAVVGVMMDCGR
jgi:hypothetical protein